VVQPIMSSYSLPISMLFPRGINRNTSGSILVICNNNIVSVASNCCGGLAVGDNSDGKTMSLV